jgi:hypothetical protein
MKINNSKDMGPSYIFFSFLFISGKEYDINIPKYLSFVKKYI